MLRFISAFLRSPSDVGAIAPSSAALATRITEPLDYSRDKVIVEFGAGTGVFSREIVSHLAPDGKFIAIEQDPALFEVLQNQLPSKFLVCNSVENLSAIMEHHGLTHIDAIVSGLPWASLPIPVQERIFSEINKWLKVGGKFMTFAYLQGLFLPGGQLLKRNLAANFRSVVKSPTVWRNLPPAFVYICRK